MLTKSHKIQWVAHRGDCEFHIENTVQSVQAAIDNGIDNIEIDIQLTKDSLPIVFHDDDLNRMFSINEKVANVSFDSIKNLPLKAKDNRKLHSNTYLIPTLATIVDIVKKSPSTTLFVEVKDVNFQFFTHQHVFKQVMALLQPIIEQVVIISFSYRFLRLVKNKTTLPIAYVIPSWAHYSQKMLRLLRPEIIFGDIDMLPKNESFEDKKETWVIYEVSNVDQANQLESVGIRCFESFIPSKLKNL